MMARPGSGAGLIQAVGCLDDSLDSATVSEKIGLIPTLGFSFDLSDSNGPRLRRAGTFEAAATLLDLSRFEHDEAEAALAELARTELSADFAPDRPPLFRLALARLPDSRTGLILTGHQALFDTESALRVWQTFAGDRPAGSDGTGIDAYRRWHDRQDFSEAEAYWRTKLKGLDELPRLPFNYRPDVGDYIRISHPLDLDPADPAGGPVNILVASAFGLLLGRYTSGREVVFGMSRQILDWAGRDGPDPGPWTNLLPVRLKIDPGLTAAQWLGRTADSLAETGPRDYFDLSRLHSLSGLPGDRPLFEAAVIIDPEPSPGIEVFQRLPYPITLFAQTGGRPKLTLDIMSGTLERDRAELLLDHLTNLIQNLAGQPERPLERINMLTDAERRTFLIDWQPDIEDRARPLVHNLVEDWAKQTPQAEAVVSRDETLTYEQLNRRTNLLAHRLIKAGVGADDFVGVYMPRAVDTVVALLAVFKAGGAYLPLDPEHPPERVGLILDDTRPKVVITRREFKDKIHFPPGFLVVLDEIDNDPDSADLMNPEVELRPENLAYVVFTSGSTGRPKGAVFRHEAMSAYLYDARRYYNITSDDRCLYFHSITSTSAIEDVFLPLSVGASTAVRTDTMLASAADFFGQLDRWGVTILDLPAFYFSFLAWDLKDAPPPECLRLIALGGEKILPAILAQWQKDVGTRIKIINGYGGTETATLAVCYDLTEEPTDTVALPIGRPLDSVRAYALDDDLNPVPVGLNGELCIAGPHVARGYLNRPELTADMFAPDPFSDKPDGLLFRTGDLVRLRPDGNFVSMGRKDRQVQLRGNRIEPGEIEAALIAHPKIEDAACVLIGDGHDSKYLAAYLTTEGRSPDREELRRWLYKKVPAYMIPTAYVFLDDMPRLASGKINRRALPAPEINPGRTGPAAEVDETTRRLIRIFQDVLKTESILPGDNFFDLGGHSLVAISLLHQVEKSFGMRLIPAAIFQAPTPASLADLIRSHDFQPNSLIPIKPSGNLRPLFFIGSVPLSPALAQRIDPERPVYGLNVFGQQAPDGEHPSLRIEDIASRYIEEIRTVQPEGPYFLSGFCADSNIALEMAKQLKAGGQVIGLVICIDFFWQRPGKTSVFKWHWDNTKLHGFKYVKSKIDWKRTMFMEALNIGLAGLLGRIQSALGRPFSQRVQTQLFLADYYQQLGEYRLGRYDFLVAVMVSGEWRMSIRPDLPRIVPRPFRIVEVEGLHNDLFVPPQVDQLARKVQKLLEEAEADQGSLR